MDKVEESIYGMMTTFKINSIQISNSPPKSLYDRVEHRWKYSLTTEINIRETTLARVMPNLDKSEMKETIKMNPIEIVNFSPKSLYDRVEQRWQYSLTTERNIREITLARLMLDLDKSEMKKTINKYKGIFSPKCQAFNILQKKFERVV